MKKHLIVGLLFLAAATNNSLATNTQTLSIFVILFSVSRKKDVLNTIPINTCRNA